MTRAVFVFLLLTVVSANAVAQSYPQGYFRNPLNIPILLAGNFGECRPGHFHSGLDIKTRGKENEPVYAAAEGYVSRIKMEPGGFGHALYVTHPNGYTTLYAHLNDFVPSIQRYLRQQQYAKESWTLDLQLKPDQFPVKKGQQIAWSGNTGGSTAPHLHFEIRDNKTEHPLNPQLFGFEVSDDVAPLLKQVAVYDLTLGIHQGVRNLYPLQKSGSAYRIRDSITVNGPVAGIGIIADDYMQGSDNTLALYTAEWYLDGKLQGSFRLDDIGYEETRYLHAYTDYELQRSKKLWSQLLFQLPGNRLNHIYASLNAARGRMEPGDNEYHEVRVVCSDVAGNNSELSFYLRCLDGPHAMPCKESADPGAVTTYNTPFASFSLDESVLYDKACILVSDVKDGSSLSPRVTIGSPGIPVHHYFELSLKPDKVIPFGLRTKVAMIYSDGKAETGRAAVQATQGLYKASVRTFGEFRLVADTAAPILKPAVPIKGNMSKARSIAFRATDNLTSVKSFRAELDGRWLLFEQRGSVWTYTFDAHCPKGKHTLVVKATDENGNEAKASYTFTR